MVISSIISFCSSLPRITLGIGVIGFLLCSLFVLTPTAEAAICGSDGKYIEANWNESDKPVLRFMGPTFIMGEDKKATIKADPLTGKPEDPVDYVKEDIIEGGNESKGIDYICDQEFVKKYADSFKLVVFSKKGEFQLEGGEDLFQGAGSVTVLELGAKASPVKLPLPKGMFGHLGSLEKLLLWVKLKEAEAAETSQTGGDKSIQLLTVTEKGGGKIVKDGKLLDIDNADSASCVEGKACIEGEDSKKRVMVGELVVGGFLTEEAKEEAEEDKKEENIKKVVKDLVMRGEQGETGPAGSDGPQGERGPKGSDGCALASSGSSSSSFPVAYLLIPAFILVGRLWRRFEK